MVSWGTGVDRNPRQLERPSTSFANTSDVYVSRLFIRQALVHWNIVAVPRIRVLDPNTTERSFTLTGSTLFGRMATSPIRHSDARDDHVAPHAQSSVPNAVE